MTAAAAGSPPLSARELGRRHPGGGGWLLEDVTLELAAGDRLALVGPSGAGKTVLLRALALLDPVDRGRILLDGEEVHGDTVPSFRRQVTYLHQRPALFEGTVETNLRRPFELAAHREPGFDRERALELLERIGRSEDFLAQDAEGLSGGEAQITALVRALQLEPRVLLLDEPTSALDSGAAENVQALVETWLDRREDAAMIWVGHDRGQSLRMTRRTVEIREGRLREPESS